MLSTAQKILLLGGSRYRTRGSDYDGTSDYATRGAALTGMADGKAGIVSLWVRFDGSDGVFQYLLTNRAGATTRFAVSKPANNLINVQGFNAAGTAILNTNTSTTHTTNAAYLHFLCSWDLAASSVLMYVDDVNVRGGGVTATNDTIAYTTTGDFAIGASNGGAGKLNGCLSEVFFHTSFLDISVDSNRRKFRNSAGRPVNLGADGSVPLGVQPLIHMPAGNPADNRGSGGTFTVVGSLDPASTSPSD